MGKTVESYRMTLEGKINRWNDLAIALRKEGNVTSKSVLLNDLCKYYVVHNHIFSPLRKHNTLNNLVLFCIIRCNYSRCFNGKECNQFR
jgi:hypothetical protein